MSEFHTFELVIRLSKVNSGPFSKSHTSVVMCVEQLLAVSGISFLPICIAGSHDNNRPFTQETARSRFT